MSDSRPSLGYSTVHCGLFRVVYPRIAFKTSITPISLSTIDSESGEYRQVRPCAPTRHRLCTRKSVHTAHGRMQTYDTSLWTDSVHREPSFERRVPARNWLDGLHGVMEAGGLI